MFRLVIREADINRILQEMGPISGQTNIDTPAYRGPANWRVTNARVQISPSGTKFDADTTVVMNTYTYNTPLRGLMTIGYDPTQNQVTLRLTKAVIDLKISILGIQIPLGQSDIAGMLKSDFSFPGIAPIATSFSLSQLDKFVTIRTATPSMTVGDGCIMIDSPLNVSIASGRKP